MSANPDGEWPVHQAGMHLGKEHAGKYVDINPLNLESYPNQKPAPDQPFELPTERQVRHKGKGKGRLVVVAEVWYV